MRPRLVLAAACGLLLCALPAGAAQAAGGPAFAPAAGAAQEGSPGSESPHYTIEVVAERHRLAPGEDVELTVTVRPDGSSPLGLAQYDVSLETVEGTLMPLTIEPATVAHRQIVTEAGDSARFRLHAVRPGTAVVSVLVAAGFQRWDPNASSLYFALIWGTTRSQPIEVVQPGG